MMGKRVLVVDDERGVREALRQVLEYEGLDVATANSGDEALKLTADFQPHLVLLDVKMAGMDGLQTLAHLREVDSGLPVVMISGHGSIQTAVEATQLGAYDFLEKPLDTDRILLTLRNALQHVNLSTENERLREVGTDRYEIVGESRAIKEALQVIEKVAPTPARVLITGENGSGKELIARAIHRQSPRADNPFVEVNCAAIPSELIESELFGHMKGSFTGASDDRSGKFEQADGGTLFLDEVGDMSAAAQAKVLRALEEGVVTRIGAAKAIKVDVRVVAATNKSLEEEITASRFREDLYYRLNVVPVEVPPLRARKEDIPLLVHKFSNDLATSFGMRPKKFGEISSVLPMWPSWVAMLRDQS
jgi:two-component system nitrogen regulation response regulator NtrX